MSGQLNPELLHRLFRWATRQKGCQSLLNDVSLGSRTREAADVEVHHGLGMSWAEAGSKYGLTADTTEGVAVSLRQDRAFRIAVPSPVSPSKVAGFERTGAADPGKYVQPSRNRPDP